MAATVIFFLAGQVATANETADIAALNARGDLTVKVRAGGGMVAGTNAAGQRYSGALDPCDYVAGTIPTAYNAKPVLKVAAFAVFPAAIQLDASNADVQQLAAVGVNAAGVPVDLAADPLVTWAVTDATTNVVTVGGDGLLTAVGAGTKTVRATYTYASGRTVTADCAVTVVA